MAMPAWVPEAWAQLNEENQKQVGDFLQSVLLQQKEADKAKKAFPFGILKGKIHMSDSFDDPLPEFEEYM